MKILEEVAGRNSHIDYTQFEELAERIEESINTNKMNEQELRRLFQNLSDECKFVKLDDTPANSMDEYEVKKSVRLMSEEIFIETLKNNKHFNNIKKQK